MAMAGEVEQQSRVSPLCQRSAIGAARRPQRIQLAMYGLCAVTDALALHTNGRSHPGDLTLKRVASASCLSIMISLAEPKPHLLPELGGVNLQDRTDVNEV
jgi:hypothetical protein